MGSSSVTKVGVGARQCESADLQCGLLLTPARIAGKGSASGHRCVRVTQACPPRRQGLGDVWYAVHDKAVCAAWLSLISPVTLWTTDGEYRQQAKSAETSIRSGSRQWDVGTATH
jgi:hypothetical protein